MLKKLKLSTLPAALCIGGYSGWVLTVMYICERSLYYYRDDSMLDSVNITFLTALTASLGVISILQLFFDVEGMLSNRVLKWLPGVFMMESGIAFCMSNANSMRVFSTYAGVAAAFGMVAVLSQLLRIKVGLRMRTIGIGLALGAAARMLTVWVITSAPQKYFFWIAVGMGVISMLTVHSTSFTAEETPLVSRAEAAPPVLLRKIPRSYFLLFILCACFWLADTIIEESAFAMLPVGVESSTYELYSYIGYLIAALVIALFVTLSRLPMVYVCAAGLAATAGCLALLPHFSSGEIELFAAICFAAVACHKAFVLLFIIIFSLDRPHPLFYAVLGYCVSTLGELVGNHIAAKYAIEISDLITLLLVLMPISGIALSRTMNKNGLNKAGFDHRHTMRAVIRKKAAELELFEREQMMVECVVLDGYNVDELASKLIFSRNTVKALLRPVLQKFNVPNLKELRAYLEKLTAEEEIFQARVREEENKLRSKKRVESVSGLIRAWREHLYRRDAKKEQKAKKKLRRTELAAQKAENDQNVSVEDNDVALVTDTPDNETPDVTADAPETVTSETSSYFGDGDDYDSDFEYDDYRDDDYDDFYYDDDDDDDIEGKDGDE